MRLNSWIIAVVSTLSLSLSACDDPGTGETGSDPTEGATEGATEGETTEGETTGGEATGDGSSDGGPMACEGDNPQGCVEGGCGEGEVCSLETEECISSACSCDEATGQWNCTPDCSGGVCVPEPEPGACEGENPQGCVTNGCGEGEACSLETEECVPSACSCDEKAGAWVCTADCGGGVCIPAEMPEPGCPGENPAELCPKDPEACIPSACECDEAAMVWNCTPDCSGGTEC